jgi:adenylate kinase family enzyme
MPRYVSSVDAVKILARAKRVLVIGCSGGGKTTFSAKIAACRNLEFQSLDRDVRWLPGWVERDRAEQRQIIAQLAQRERWVMDGSGASSFDLRLPQTELVLWVRVPRRVALFGLFKRVLRYYGSVRPAMADGCPEPLPDREFLSYIWNFEKQYAPMFIERINQYGSTVPVVVLRSHREMDAMLQPFA